MKKLLKKIEVRHLLMAFLVMFVLDEIRCRYLAMQHGCAVSELYETVGFYWLSPVFGIVDLMIGCLLLLKTIHNSVCYIPKEYDVLTVEKSFLWGNTLHTFSFTVENLYNNLENIRFWINVLLSTFICLLSIVSLIMDVYLFFKP